jgi:hypothetical protein
MAILTAFVLVVPAPDFRADGGQEKAKDSDSSVIKGLRLSVELVGDELFHPKNTITIKVKLKNTSKAPVYLHKQLGIGPGGFRITILDANNSWVPPNIIRETFPTPALSKEDLQAIEPGKAIEQEIDIALFHYEMMPGHYTLKVAYVSPVAPEDATRGLTVLFSEDGKLEAKPIRFKILLPPLNLSYWWSRGDRTPDLRIANASPGRHVDLSKMALLFRGSSCVSRDLLEAGLNS